MHANPALVTWSCALLMVISGMREYGLAMQSPWEMLQRKCVITITTGVVTISVVTLTDHMSLSTCVSSPGTAVSGFVKERHEQMPHWWDTSRDDNHRFFRPNWQCQSWVGWILERTLGHKLTSSRGSNLQLCLEGMVRQKVRLGRCGQMEDRRV